MIAELTRREFGDLVRPEDNNLPQPRFMLGPVPGIGLQLALRAPRLMHSLLICMTTGFLILPRI